MGCKKLMSEIVCWKIKKLCETLCRTLRNSVVKNKINHRVAQGKFRRVTQSNN